MLRDPSKESMTASQNSSIPKVIHQIWIGPNPPPTKWINSFKVDFIKHNPGWTYRLWTEKEINQLELVNRELYDQEKNLAGKADILRYEILYQFGGVYIDADSQWLNQKSLDPLLARVNETGLFAGREDHRLIGICVIGASQNNPILKYTIETLRKLYHQFRVEEKWDSWVSTGPGLFTECVKSFGITIFPIHYFYPLSWHYDQRAANLNDFPDSYMLHYGYSTNNFAAVDLSE